jgi:hypothetical protein
MATDRSDDLHIIYVELLDEGIKVWRPVPARKLDSGYQLLPPDDYDPLCETWRFM